MNLDKEYDKAAEAQDFFRRSMKKGRPIKFIVRSDYYANLIKLMMDPRYRDNFGPRYPFTPGIEFSGVDIEECNNMESPPFYALHM
ncbi:MAG: hypothetical protein D6746_08540 [Bacteroidetes bacterium]|nr:MAG: hypothetical protein D6746_08540 [Bacteroidota bacterium]